VFALDLGGVFLAAQAIGGHFSDGLVSLGSLITPATGASHALR